MNRKKALITGITGQAGSFLGELLLEKDYEVHGLIRRTSINNTERIDHIIPYISLHEGDIIDAASVSKIISDVRPDELYNLAAQSHVGSSFTQPSSTFMINTIGHINVLEAFKNFTPQGKLLFAATSELFGESKSSRPTLPTIAGEPRAEFYQDIHTPFLPNSPYAISKLASFHMTKSYRDAYNLWCCSTIANNHESTRRTNTFVTRKITKYIGELVKRCGQDKDRLSSFRKLKLGNINSSRDFSHAKDIVNAYYMIMQQTNPKDYVIGSGITHTVKEFLEAAFKHVGLNWEDYVEIDPSNFRPNEVPYLRCDSSEIRKDLGWENTVSFEQLVKEMVDADINGN